MDDQLRERFATVIDAAIDRSEGVPMRWGRNDCALWTASIVRRVLGYDPAADFRGKYWSQRRAFAALGKGGLPVALSRAARRHKWTRVDARDAQPGDIGYCKTGDNLVACVINRSPGWWIGRVDRGYAVIRDASVIRAWKVV